MFKKTYKDLRACKEATMTESEFNSQVELEALEDKLSPRPEHVFGNAITKTTRFFEQGVQDL